MINWDLVKNLSDDLKSAWKSGNQVFICGNGGSATNANHLANDFLYGISPKDGKGMKVHSLCANIAVNTCLANDTGYENIFSNQLMHSSRIAKIFSLSFREAAIPQMLSKPSLKAHDLGMKTHAILGFDGGKCKELADNPIHIPIDNMQVAEDFQMMIGHILMLDLKGKNENE